MPRSTQICCGVHNHVLLSDDLRAGVVWERVSQPVLVAAVNRAIAAIAEAGEEHPVATVASHTGDLPPAATPLLAFVQSLHVRLMLLMFAFPSTRLDVVRVAPLWLPTLKLVSVGVCVFYSLPNGAVPPPHWQNPSSPWFGQQPSHSSRATCGTAQRSLFATQSLWRVDAFKCPQQTRWRHSRGLTGCGCGLLWQL